MGKMMEDGKCKMEDVKCKMGNGKKGSQGLWNSKKPPRFFEVAFNKIVFRFNYQSIPRLMVGSQGSGSVGVGSTGRSLNGNAGYGLC